MKKVKFLAMILGIVFSLLSLAACNASSPSIEINSDGYWVINGNATNVKAQGIDGQNGTDGANGKDGVDGKDGADGITPTVEINSDGYWVINGNATNVKASCQCQESTTPPTTNGGFVHLSFDDTSLCFINLASKNYQSLFDEPFLAWLWQLHETYGAKFSLYCFTSDLKKVPSDYASEFFNARDWLKIGLHADTSSSNFSNYDYATAKTSWNDFANEVVRITGSYLNIDRMPRLHMFAGSENALKGMRDGNYGALGFISTDDSRLPYYLDASTAEYLYSHDHMNDHVNGLTFVATDIRADWFISGFTSQNTYRQPTFSNMYDELNHRFSNLTYANSSTALIIFIHEWQFYNGSTLNSSRTAYIEDACRFAAERNIRFSYPQEEHFFNTSADIR